MISGESFKSTLESDLLPPPYFASNDGCDSKNCGWTLRYNLPRRKDHGMSFWQVMIIAYRSSLISWKKYIKKHHSNQLELFKRFWSTLSICLVLRKTLIEALPCYIIFYYVKCVHEIWPAFFISNLFRNCSLPDRTLCKATLFSTIKISPKITY